MKDASQPRRSSSLTTRRRRQTARDIQNETLRLALKHGFAQVTTGMIAESVGISLRTFFNYYPNKEAALAGEPLKFGDFDLDWFRISEEPFLSDLERLLGQLIAEVEISRERLVKIDELCTSDPKLRAIFTASLQGLVDQLSVLFATRLGEESQWTADLVADLVGRALTNAFQVSAHRDIMTTEAVLDVTIRQLSIVGELLQPPRQ